MNMSAKPFTLVVTLRGGLIEIRSCDSIAEAEARFGELVGTHRADCAEILAADRPDVPLRVLRVR